jgi:hypothetical protein
MIGLAIVIAGTLLLALCALALAGWLTSRTATQASQIGQPASLPAPLEFFHSVFSDGDWEFVRQMNSLALKKLFITERKRVALSWVAETCAALNLVMRQHALAARHSSNLNPVTELTIFAGYLSLLVLCGLLSLTIRLMGPMRLGGLAQLAHGTSLRIADAHHSLQATARPPTPTPV